jgi:2-hydroxychromene-2-carboxylate isomerase
MTSQFYYDVVCPYAYMAFMFLNRSNLFTSLGLRLAPILLGGLFKEMQTASDPNQAMPEKKRAYFSMDIERQAAYFGVPLSFHPRHPVSTVKAMRLIHASKENQRLELTERLYKAYWQDNLDIDDEAVLAAIAGEFGISAAAQESAKEVLRQKTAEAFKAKVFGVPTIAHKARLYFGADRLVLLEKELGISLPSTPWGPCDPIVFYFDFSSPYSYLAWTEVKKAEALGARFLLKPILLGALFKEVGTNSIPMLSAHPHKTAYYLQDMMDWAHYRSVPFTFNSHFPLRTVTPLRVALVDRRVIDRIFSAAWAENLDIGDPTILARILNQAGFADENLLERCEEEGIKDQLKANTAQALSQGVFGVPTFFVRNQQVFGQDRFSWMRQEINQA